MRRRAKAFLPVMAFYLAAGILSGGCGQNMRAIVGAKESDIDSLRADIRALREEMRARTHGGLDTTASWPVVRWGRVRVLRPRDGVRVALLPQFNRCLFWPDSVSQP